MIENARRDKLFDINRPIDFYLIGTVLLVILSQYNTAKWGASFSYIVISVAFVFLGALLSNAKVRKESLLIIPFFGVYFISTVFSSIVDIQRDILTFALFCIFYIVITSHRYNKKCIQIIILIYILVAFTASINVCYQWINHNYLQAWVRRSTFVFMGIKKDPNYSMSYIAPSTILSVYIFLNSKKLFIKSLCLINALVTLLACICASTRAGMLAVFIPIVLIVLFNKRIKNHTRLFLLVSLALAVFLGLFIILNTYNGYGLNRFFGEGDGSGRLELWKASLEVFRSNPIFGGGMNSGSAVSMQIIGNASHSIMLDILCDSGLLGIFSFVVFFVENCLKSTKKNREFQFIITISFLIPMLFINGFNTTTFYFPIILLTIFSLYTRNSLNDYSSLFNYDNWRLV